jgi:hypothetical protein
MGAQGCVPRVLGMREAVSGRLCWLLTLASACAACWVSAVQAGADGLRVRVSADYTWDDNVPRATSDQRLSDSFATLTAVATVPLQLTQQSRVLLSGTLGGQKFDHFSGLDHGFANFQGEVQYRSSGRYTAPIWSIFLRAGIDAYISSDLRDGYRATAGVSVRKPVTDRIFLFGALAYNQGNARSTVFDTKDVSLRGNIDYSFARRHTVYLGLEYRQGDSVSTGLPSLAFLDIAKAVVADDVFTNPQRFDYRFQARTGLVTLGYNFAIAERQSLDISYRAVYSQPIDQPPSSVSTSTIYYVDQQITVSYLIRF